MTTQKPESVADQIGGTLEVLEKLANLKNKGIITEDEFNTKKAELLEKQTQAVLPARIESTAALPKELATDETKAIPSGVKGFSWGALVLAPFWAGTYKLNKFAAPLYLAFIWGYWGEKITKNETVLLAIGVPLSIISLILSFYLAFKGRELAWQTGKFTDVEKFIKHQKIWNICSIIIGGLLLVLLGFVGYDLWKKEDTGEIVISAVNEQVARNSKEIIVPDIATQDGFGRAANIVLRTLCKTRGNPRQHQSAQIVINT